MKKISKLEGVTERYYREGPLKAIKQSTQHYSYLFMHVLADLPLISDTVTKERFVRKMGKYTELV